MPSEMVSIGFATGLLGLPLGPMIASPLGWTLVAAANSFSGLKPYL